MKEKMVSFLFKRLTGKVSQLREAGFHQDEYYDAIVDDMDVYLEALKDILQEVILP